MTQARKGPQLYSVYGISASGFKFFWSRPGLEDPPNFFYSSRNLKFRELTEGSGSGFSSSLPLNNFIFFSNPEENIFQRWISWFPQR